MIMRRENQLYQWMSAILGGTMAWGFVAGAIRFGCMAMKVEGKESAYWPWAVAAGLAGAWWARSLFRRAVEKNGLWGKDLDERQQRLQLVTYHVGYFLLIAGMVLAAGLDWLRGKGVDTWMTIMTLSNLGTMVCYRYLEKGD